MNKNRRWLFLLLAAGLIALGAGGGTFATFNAETANPGNSFATGTLYLSDTVSATACFSFTGANNQNTTSSTGCGTVIDVTGQEPGTTPDSNAATGTVTLKNIGTLDGNLTASAGTCASTPLSATTTGDITSATATIKNLASTTGILVGMEVTDGTSLHGAYLPSPVYVTDITGTTVSLSANATTTASGDTFNFTSASSGSLCTSLDAFVTGGTGGTCYYGQCPLDDGGNQQTTGNITSGTASIAVASATGIVAGMQVFDTSHSSYLPTGVTVTGVSGTTVSLSAAATNGATGDSFTFRDAPGSLNALSSATILNPALSLSAGSSKTLTIGLYLPDGGSNGADNNLMALESTFDLTFTLTQS